MRAVALADAADPAVFGGKAAQLAAARRGGLPVPDGFALPVSLVDAVASGDVIACAEVERVFARLGGPVAARSSAVGEDSARASFAGQYVTRLHVTSAGALIAAVRDVRASGEGAAAYRARVGVGGAARVAVVVQRMVAAELAGVLFTRCPVTGRDERVVEAARGLGEAVVGGLVNPERLRVDRSGRLVERAAADQDVMIVPRDGGGTEERAVAERAAPLLGDHHVRALHALAVHCDAVFGDGGHDLEWAFAGDEVFLLQRRPITR